MTKKIALMLADGFEETEAMVPADILRRLGCEVVLAGVGADIIRGSHNIYIKPEIRAESLKAEDLDCVILPGGLPGATNLRDSAVVQDLLKKVYAQGGVAAAICAAPIALAQAGLTAGKRITGYPGSEKLSSVELHYTGNMAESDSRVVTGKGPGAAFVFAFRLAAELGFSEQKLNDLKNGMFVTL